jgi:hypothetical protein
MRSRCGSVLSRRLEPVRPAATFAPPIGQVAGTKLTLAAESLRTSGVELYGAAKGQSGELTFDVEEVPLGDIETAWQRSDLRGKRLVVVP